MFEILSIQAGNGDSFLVSYGTHGDLRHLLIDGGTTDSIGNLLETLNFRRSGQRLRLEALVVTHYDLDHIQGAIGLLRSPPEWLDIGDVWFNGLHHLCSPDLLGPNEGSELSRLIKERGYCWNEAFGGNAILSGRHVNLPGQMSVSVVSPGLRELKNLAGKWRAGELPAREDQVVAAPDVLGQHDVWPPGDFATVLAQGARTDTSVANGSSIALILEVEGKKALLTGDAFSSVVASGIRYFCPTGPFAVDLLKLSHHGSKRNTDEEFLSTIKCEKFLISTNGSIHMHPDNTLMARILMSCKTPLLIFNYKSGQSLLWENIPDGWPLYKTLFPNDEEHFVRIRL